MLCSPMNKHPAYHIVRNIGMHKIWRIDHETILEDFESQKYWWLHSLCGDGELWIAFHVVVYCHLFCSLHQHSWCRCNEEHIASFWPKFASPWARSAVRVRSSTLYSLLAKRQNWALFLFFVGPQVHVNCKRTCRQYATWYGKGAIIERIKYVIHCAKLRRCFNPNRSFLSCTKQNKFWTCTVCTIVVGPIGVKVSC